MNTLPIQTEFVTGKNGQLYLTVSQNGKQILLSKDQALTLMRMIQVKLDKKAA